jgi:hypothetical protein
VLEARASDRMDADDWRDHACALVRDVTVFSPIEGDTVCTES